ncbi:hypothetical protein BDR26DRAFT_214259 [Obelidium mucronatum]|nr:hypothetical protein BDR26DRAFT_214259 [Obelidium mucronatum]
MQQPNSIPSLEQSQERTSTALYQSARNQFQEHPTTITHHPHSPFPTFCGSNVAVPGSPYFTAPLYSKPQSSFLIPVIHHTWKNFPAGSPSYGTPDTCTFVTLSLTAIETSLKAIPVTPNSILSIVDGNTGNMIATSAAAAAPPLNASSSFNVNNQGTLYPALANPNKMVSASVSYLVTKWSSFNTIQSIRKLGRTEGSFVSSDGDWGEVFVSAAWISDISLGLNWLLIQSVPASDFEGYLGKRICNLWLLLLLL